jgi:hypothetical protein
MQDTIELIKQWGADRGITINGTHRGQWLKLVSEYGELCDNLAKGRDIRDDIGDMFVVLVMICEIGKTSIEDAVNMAASLKYPDADVYDLVGWLMCEIQEIQYRPNTTCVVAAIGVLTALAEAHGTTLDECIEIAYNDIKDRKGFLNTDGVFIKESA